MTYKVQFGRRQIDFSLEYRKRKSLGIRVLPEGKVEVLAPPNMHETEIFIKVKKRAPWIIKQIDYFHTFIPTTPPRRFISGETHLFLGKQYKLKVIPDEDDVIKAYQGQLLMHSRSTRPEALKHRLNIWYRNKAAVVFNDLLKRAFLKFRRYQVVIPSLTIRRMVKRWGSCTPTGRIILNIELIKAPKGCIEYVIIHELCHLVHYHHRQPFLELLDEMMQDWRKWKERLEYSLI